MAFRNGFFLDIKIKRRFLYTFLVLCVDFRGSLRSEKAKKSEVGEWFGWLKVIENRWSNKFIYILTINLDWYWLWNVICFCESIQKPRSYRPEVLFQEFRAKASIWGLLWNRKREGNKFTIIRSVNTALLSVFHDF